MTKLPAEAVQLIISAERNMTRCYVPKGSPSSGVTLGIGYDMAHQSKEDIARDWLPFLNADSIKLLQGATSLVGVHAESYLPYLSGVWILPAHGLEVFENSSLPKYARMTINAYPEAAMLHGLCYGALVSLVFNRGPSMGVLPRDPRVKDSRWEMREIRSVLRDGKPEEVPALIRAMKRLWEGKGLGGLLVRRDAEADMFQRGLEA